MQGMSHEALADVASEFVKLSGDNSAVWQQLLPECPAVHLQV